MSVIDENGLNWMLCYEEILRSKATEWWASSARGRPYLTYADEVRIFERVQYNDVKLQCGANIGKIQFHSFFKCKYFDVIGGLCISWEYVTKTTNW